ncbi:Hg(II)-responsive transcriptional regulator [Castellaniella sp. FW104-16D08]|uniref:Hg(II)-responsive transcriptional regulator n=1 Tax=unclassified Castellaniella TaxID=2617606 RepID=UPI0033162DF3
MENTSKTLTVGLLAQAVGITVEAIRFYQRKGLMPLPERAYGSIRRYTDADLDRVRFIKTSQRLGFSLAEVGELLKLDDGTHCEDAREIAEHKLQDVREKLADLQRIERALDQLVAQCDSAHNAVKCPLIASLREPNEFSTKPL